MKETSDNRGVAFLRWALPRMGYRWEGFRKPRGQVLKRVRGRMQELGLSGGYPAYRDFLEEHPQEWERLDRLCDVTISKFFRDRKLWDYLRDEVLPDLLREAGWKRNVEIWSAGCCNGEEPYSMAIICEQLASSVKQVAILATDRNPNVLERARRGCYPSGALKELTDRERASFFHKPETGTNGNESKRDTEMEEDTDTHEIDDRLRPYVEFRRHDIREDPPEGTFDLVLCRNLVFTYFDKTHRQQFLQRLKPHLRPGGRLVTGSNETIPETGWLEQETRTFQVFRRDS